MLACNGRLGSLASTANPCPIRTERQAHVGSTVTVCWQPALLRPAGTGRQSSAVQCMPATCQLSRLVCISGNIRTWRPRLQRAKVCHVATVIAEVGLMVPKLLLAVAVT